MRAAVCEALDELVLDELAVVELAVLDEVVVPDALDVSLVSLASMNRFRMSASGFVPDPVAAVPDCALVAFVVAVESVVL